MSNTTDELRETVANTLRNGQYGYTDYATVEKLMALIHRTQLESKIDESKIDESKTSSLIASEYVELSTPLFDALATRRLELQAALEKQA